jgi:hypothetical protein
MSWIDAIWPGLFVTMLMWPLIYRSGWMSGWNAKSKHEKEMRKHLDDRGPPPL